MHEYVFVANIGSKDVVDYARLIRCHVTKEFLMASSSAAQVQEALALLQKTSSTDGGSLYEQLTKLIVKVLLDICFSLAWLFVAGTVQVLKQQLCGPVSTGA